MRNAVLIYLARHWPTPTPFSRDLLDNDLSKFSDFIVTVQELVDDGFVVIDFLIVSGEDGPLAEGAILTRKGLIAAKALISAE